MNNLRKPRTRRAQRDKDSILADAKNLLYVLYTAAQKMPKIERMEGAPLQMKIAATQIIHSFSVAKECPEVRLDEIHKMIGAYGVLLAHFDLCIVQGLMTDGTKVRVAQILERIGEGVKKWRNATRSPKSQEQQQVAAATTAAGGGIQSVPAARATA